jgi:hypothetical protein
MCFSTRAVTPSTHDKPSVAATSAMVVTAHEANEAASKSVGEKLLPSPPLSRGGAVVSREPLGPCVKVPVRPCSEKPMETVMVASYTRTPQPWYRTCMALPPCGLYRTTNAVAGVPAGRLVYFHNHGNPGAGIYLPTGWVANRADWAAEGYTLASETEAHHLEALPAEGLYRVTQSFFCCSKRCVQFQPDRLVQLGYNGQAEAILFFPELGGTGLSFPSSGTVVDRLNLKALAALTVNASAAATAARPAGGFVH